ncbi:MAG TPA: GMC family oxidoreductase N-terminal domain-containing protein [Streptosporangiaceae bacterium]|nr:GMC family oxidoreductase N-terminal domain-containing protein [Streptosporangiaceae bacterium]
MTDQDSFDYVVVGAGSAGCVLAARLTEDPAVSVLLLEAGPPADADEVRIPAAFSALFRTRWDWNYTTVEQKQLGGRRAYWPRMKAVGGCSAMNAMIYMRGNRVDYDGWRDGHGAAGWGYADVLPYFIRSEGNTRLGEPYHGRTGPLHVEDRRYSHELSRAWVQAAVAWGLKPTDDFNGAAQEGAGLYQVTCKRGRRWSAADGYLNPALDRPNLEVRTSAQATRIVVRGARATGVEYRQQDTDRTAHVGAEVLLAGGAINSPQLLLLSGVGPAAHLRELGISVVADLPVGENLQDHPVVPLLWHTRGTTDLLDFATPGRLAQWRLLGRGPLASNVGEAGAFFASRDGLPAPDIQALTAPTGFYDNGLREPTSRMVATGATLVAVASRGRLRLATRDPLWRPEIDAGYFDDPADLDAMLAGCRTLLEIADQAPMRRLRDRPFLPADGRDSTDEQLLGHIRDRAQTLYHPAGTCAMGSGEGAVVDPQLRVYGIEGLRVVDASVMPAIPRGNTNAPTIMIAEKAADLVRGMPPLTAQEPTP